MVSVLGAWSDRFAPDIAATIRRFPYASALLLATTVVALLIINEIVDAGDFNPWGRLAVGLAFGALLAAGIKLHAETRPPHSTAARYLGYVLPLILIALFQVTDTRFALVWPLSLVVILVVSLSMSFHRAKDSEGQQIAFWKSNSRAIPTAIFAIAIGLIIGLALFATSWSLEMLFALEISWILERLVYPVLALLMIPLYWLSTLPRPGEDISVLPAAGLVGQFVMIPFTLVYSVILHAYAIQILIEGALPVGVVGQMVFYFTIAGLLTWILVYPGVVPQSPLVRLFRVSWFALSVVPLILFVIALGERIEAFGLTPTRVVFIGFGVWAAGVTILFLITRGRADIRWIPGLAALVLAMLSIGPQNIENLPRWQQALRLQALLSQAHTPEGFVWEADDRRAASAAFGYLAYEAQQRDRLATLLRDVLGEDAIPPGVSLDALRTLTGLDTAGPASSGERDATLRLNVSQGDAGAGIDTSAFPYFHGAISMSPEQTTSTGGALVLGVDGSEVFAERNGVEIGRVSVSDWIARQDLGEIRDPLFVVEEGEIAVYVESLSYRVILQDGSEIIEVQSLYGYLFSGAPDL